MDSPNPSRQRWAWRATAAAGCVLASFSLLLNVILFERTAAGVDDNCQRVHRIVDVGSEVIEGGKPALKQYRADGLLSQKQYRRAINDVDRQLVRWRSADCPTPKPK